MSSEEKISPHEIMHYDLHRKKEILTNNYLPRKKVVKILLTSGASCPDALIEGVITKLVEFFPSSKNVSDVLRDIK